MYQGVQAVLGLIICRLGCRIRENASSLPKLVITLRTCSLFKGTRIDAD